MTDLLPDSPSSLRLLCLAVTLMGAAVLTGKATAAAHAATRPTLEQLVSCIPSIKSDDAWVRSCELRATHPWHHLSYRLAFRQPDQFALFVQQTDDGTPLMVASGGHVIVYDSRAGEVLHFLNAGFSVEAYRDTADQFSHRVGLRFKGSLVNVDLRTLFNVARDAGDLKVAGPFETVYTLTGHAGPARVSADVDWQPDAGMLRHAAVEGFIVINELRLNQPVPDKWFVAPAVEGLLGLPVRGYSARDAEEHRNELEDRIQSIYYRCCLFDKAARQKIDSVMPGRFDWQKWAKVDSEVTPLWRSEFRTPADWPVESTR